MLTTTYQRGSNFTTHLTNLPKAFGSMYVVRTLTKPTQRQLRRMKSKIIKAYKEHK